MTARYEHDSIRDQLSYRLRSLALLRQRLSLVGSQRVFAVGLSKTGTSSLTAALKLLGFRTRHFPIEMVGVDRGALTLRRSIAASYQSLTDTPVSALYRHLDTEFPGSKFILTVRDIDGWLRSCETHFARASWGRKIDLLHDYLYGGSRFDRRRFGESYERHVLGVEHYFQDRTSELLVLDVIGGEGWERLCPFLDVPRPQIDFPWANRTFVQS